MTVVLGWRVSSAEVTTSLLVSDTNVEGRGVGTTDDPNSTEVASLTPPLVEVGDMSGWAYEISPAGVEAEVTDRERPAVGGAGCDTVVDGAGDSGFELVAAAVLLEVRTSFIEELMMDVTSMTAEEVVGSKLVT